MIRVVVLAFTYLRAFEPALRGRFFPVVWGKICVSLGHNDAGRSTIKKILILLLRVDHGTVSVLG